MTDNSTPDADDEYVFGEFVFNRRRRELRKKGERIDLNPQPARLLETLLVRAPGTVTRDALQHALWGDKTTVEFEQSLNTCVGQLRAALGDSAKEAKFIQTEPKVGYRFLAPVKVSNGAHRPRRRWIAMAAGVFAAAAIATVVLFPSGRPPETALQRIADPEIYDLILRARSMRKFGDRDAMRASLAQFEHVLQRAPDEPAALGGAALNLAVLAGSQGFPAAETYARANALSDRAITNRAPSVDGLLARGFIALYDQWNIESARNDFERAVLLAPHYAIAHAWTAAAHAADGALEKAADASLKATELEPSSWYAHADRCWYLLFNEAYEEALNVCAGAVELEPEILWSQLGLMEAYRRNGDFASALSLIEDMAARINATPPAFADETPAERYVQTACALAHSLARQSEGASPHYFIASFYAQCGAFPETAEWLKTSHAGGESPILFYYADPRFSAFRNSDIGQALMLDVNKRQEKSAS